MRNDDSVTMVARGAEHSKLAVADQPAQRIGRGLVRAVAACGFGFALLPLARAVELSCALAMGGGTSTASGSAEVATASATASSTEMSVVGRIGETAGTIASSVASISGMCAAALAALALATILLAIRAHTPRIGATITALALFAALGSHATEMRNALLTLAPGAFGITVALSVVVATTVLVARWIEDVALTVALEKTMDPLQIGAEVDAEAREAARLGVTGIDPSSYRLAGALGRASMTSAYDGAVVDEPGLSGRGSPIPCRMPDDGPLPARVA